VFTSLGSEIEAIYVELERKGLKTHFSFFNQERTHQSLARQTPDEVYFADRLRIAA